MNNNHIEQDFSKAAPGYDEHAHIQRLAADTVLSRLDYFILEPNNILDLGSGTGYLTKKLKDKFPKTRVTGIDISQDMCSVAKVRAPELEFIVADLYDMPFAGNSFDLIVSSFTFQWCEDLGLLFNKIQKVARPDALFLFATVGKDSLKEIGQSWAGVDKHQRLMEFADMHDIGDLLLASGWQQPVMDIDRHINYYPDVKSIFKEFKGLGVTNKNQARPRGLTGKHKLHKFVENYENLRQNKGLPLSWEIVYGFCRKAEGIKFEP